ncbi:MAG: nucleotidyltransferase family protein [Lachnospiraceae bacterium]|nr:nucleotidyltransferase family protein [Lachnospiraceae bacterium]
MKITGIIAEYNPFHLGHAYQIAEARRITGADYIVVVMSGDYVQRGAPAILDKRTRTEMALNNGADLVLELPLRYAVSGAADFAWGAVNILHQLGCVDCLCFGSESGDIRPFQRIARLLSSEPLSYRQELQRAMRDGCTYPAAHQRALLVACREIRLFDDCDDFSLEEFLSGPNNTLGLEYLRALSRISGVIKPVTLSRTQNNYHQETLEGSFVSATALRKTLLSDSPDYETYVPENCLPILSAAVKNRVFLTEDDFSRLLIYQLLSENRDSLSAYLESTTSIANRILSLMNRFETFSQFAEALKTRDMTRARINRILLHIILGIKKTDEAPAFIRMLGFKRTSSALLTKIKQTATAPVLGKLDKQSLESYRQDLFASNLYNQTLFQKSGITYREEREQQLVITGEPG